jgi:tetratricopeptide (TPR) repeat protein
MTAERWLSADLSADGPVPLRGCVDGADHAAGIGGWCVDLADPARPLRVEFCVGGVVVASAAANLPRDDIRRLGFPRSDVGFRFGFDDLRSALAANGVAADIRLRVRVATAEFSLRSRFPLPSASEIMATDGPEGSEFAAAAVAENLSGALWAMAARAAETMRRGLAEGVQPMAGRIECLHLQASGLIWMLGWKASDLPLHAPVAVVSDGARHPSALVLATLERTDLPAGRVGFFGALRTDWRPQDGRADIVYVEGRNGARLRLPDDPKLLTGGECVEWVEKRGSALQGRFVEPLRRMFSGVALEAARAEDAQGGFDGFMNRGACRRAEGGHGEALALFQAALALRPRAAWARMAAASTLRDLGRADEADAACRALLADEPDHTGALMALGHCVRSRGGSAGALPLFQAALAVQPEAVWARMAVADTLADLGRYDEAEAACRAVLEADPANFGALMSLGHIANANKDRAAAEWFERAVQASPDAVAGRLALAAALRNHGDFDAARRAADALLAREPGNFEGWMSLGHTERTATRREAALEAFARAAALKPDSPAPLVQMAVEERRLGRPEACERLLGQALALDESDAEALLQLGEHFRVANTLDRALEALRRAIASPRPTHWASLAASQVLVDLGEMGEALRTLDAAEARFGAKPEFAAKRSELLRRTGDWPAARAVAEQAERTWPRHFGIWFELASLERIHGAVDGVAARPGEAAAGNAHERARVHLLQGLAAADRWSFDEAKGHFARSIELNPDDGWPRISLAQARLLTLDIDGAREQLRAVAQLDLAAAKLQGRTANISQTHLGQLLDEFVLDREALDELRAVQDSPPAERVGPLLDLVARYPDYTPAAVGLITALRQSGRLARRPGLGAPAGLPPRIPPIFAQYCDDPDPPRDLATLMGSWGRLYPRYVLRRFSDERARAFLARFHAADVQAAYHRSRQPAQKADIFRLAYLASQGGFYADADDRLVGDLDALRIPGAGLVLYQEDIGTIGNNVIGAVPGHPLITRALRLAVDAINRGDTDILWLSTGPGMLTRAFAGLLAEPGREPLAALDEVVVLEHG